MKKLFTILFCTLLCIDVIPHHVFAGKPLNNFTSYQKFLNCHHEVVTMVFKDSKTVEEHKIEMIYPETAKKEMRMQGLGLEYTKGELYFLEVPNKNDGVYVSFNEKGLLDALIIEVNKDRRSAIMFTMNEVIVSMVGLLLSPSSKIDNNEYLNVINGTKAYIDIHCTNQNGESFYLRIKDVHDPNHPFYRIAMFRL